MIVRFVLAAVLGPVVLLCLAVALGYANAGPLVRGRETGFCIEDGIEYVQLAVAFAAVAAAVRAVARPRVRSALLCVALVGAWGVTAAEVGDCGIGADDEAEARAALATAASTSA